MTMTTSMTALDGHYNDTLIAQLFIPHIPQGT